MRNGRPKIKEGPDIINATAVTQGLSTINPLPPLFTAKPKQDNFLNNHKKKTR